MKARVSYSTDGGKVERHAVISAQHTRCDCGKSGYTSRKMAKAAAAVARRDTGESIHAYKCVRNGHVFHIGHDRPFCPTCQTRHDDACEVAADAGAS